jgi:murein DD-endopeptidase MepM/ murein hydrolase activator NlpD
MLLVIGGIGWGLYSVATGDHLTTVLDRTPPRVTLPTGAVGIGNEPVRFSVALGDEGAGIGAVVVQVTQNGETREVLAKTFAVPRDEEVFEIELAARALKLGEGAAELTVRVVDDSVWSTETVATTSLAVDYGRPKLEVLSLQHVASVGGAEFVVFRASDAGLAATGVTVGGVDFPAFELATFAAEVPAGRDLYGALFALPLDFKSGAPIEVYARDGAGNVARSPLMFRIEPGRPVEVNSKLTVPFLEAKMPELMDKFVAAADNAERPDLSTPEGLRASFRFINEDYRAILNEKLRRLFESPLTPRRWTNEVFLRPMPAATSSVFGERRAYSLDGTPVSTSLHNGVDLASTGNAPVQAVQNGTVVMAEDLGIYGNTVVIDHGAGLFSLYGHLATMLVDVGATVDRGVTIGRTGTTGLAGGDHLHFEFRVRNVPVIPIEWWDAKWLTDNIAGKVAAAVEMTAPSANPT